MFQMSRECHSIGGRFHLCPTIPDNVPPRHCHNLKEQTDIDKIFWDLRILFILPKIVRFSWIPIFICYRFTIGHPEKTVKSKILWFIYFECSEFAPPLLRLVRPTCPEMLFSHSWKIKQRTFYHEMCLTPLLTDTVDVILQSCLLLLCIDAGQVEPMVPTKLFGFKPICLI